MAYDVTYPTPQATEGKPAHVNLGMVVFATQAILDRDLEEVHRFMQAVENRTLHVNVQSAFDFATAKAMIEKSLTAWEPELLARVQIYDHGQCPPLMPKGAIFLELLQDKVLERFMDK